MKATELRIGNYVSDYGIGGKFKVKSISRSVIQADRGKGVVEFHIDDLEPIPLTEEWLLKFGSKPYGTNYLYSRFKLIWKEGYNYWYVVDFDSLTYLTKIEFVHEWQNFNHIMNGEELTIKETIETN